MSAPINLSERPAHQCLGCNAWDTAINGRILRCRKCEVVYFIPAVQLVKR